MEIRQLSFWANTYTLNLFIQSCHVDVKRFQPTTFIIKIAVCHLCFPLAELTPFRVEEVLKGFSLRTNGRLRAKKSGYYYIYAQVFFEPYPEGPRSRNRVALVVNGRTVSLMQKGLGKGRSEYGTLFTGAVKYLKRGDFISLKTVYPSKLWLSEAHTFFGAYRIGSKEIYFRGF